MNTLVAVLSNIEKTQKELIGCMVAQVCENVENCSVIDFYKDFKLNKNMYGEYDLFKAEQWLYNGWKDVYKNYRELLQPYDNVILIKTPTLRGSYTSTLDEDLLRKLDKGFTKHNDYQMSQDLMKRLIERLVFVKACRDKNVFQFVVDINEVDFSKVWEFNSYKRVFVIKHNSMDYFPMYEWAMANTFIQDIDKAQDLYFVASSFTESRRKLLDKYKTELYKNFGRRRVGFVRNNAHTGLFDYYNNDDRRDVKVDQSRYMYNLKLSKYTVVIPPYNVSCFNMVRFMEAIICDCFPIILPECNLHDVSLTFPDISDKIKEKGLVLKKRDNRKLPVESYLHLKVLDWGDDISVTQEIKSCKSYKKITDKEYVKSEFEKLLRR